MDNGTRMMGIYVLVSLLLFCLCIGGWMAFNSARKPTKVTPTATPVKAVPNVQQVKPTSPPVAAQPKTPVTPRATSVQAKSPTPRPAWIPLPGYGGIIRYKIEPLP